MIFPKIAENRWIIAALLLLFAAAAAIVAAMNASRAEAADNVAAARAELPVLVIDAGHGGLDGGASSADGMTENEVNLAIALRLEALASLCGAETVMTRTALDLNYPDESASIAEKKVWDQNYRLLLINSIKNAVLISIHQNAYPDPRPSGTLVLYGAAEGSSGFGEALHSQLAESFNPENRRVAAPAPDSVYLMRSVTCPAVLAECGFLSNPQEAEKLADDGYRLKLAMAMASVFLRYWSAA
ncbi:MAG: N-acetylmuramoyl-L-alanine amidase [Oscillospiraceae bacterium]|nr:N-acetylmuramoyl-L-alanine amidase [Oscillospiraceae bacterium]